MNEKKPMKIRLYIVTYKKHEVLNKNLASLWESEFGKHDLEVTVLSNHSEVIIDSINERHNLRVVINTVRSPLAWGCLSKDWNYSLLDGFKHSTNPDKVDWVILAQNDVIWKPGWVNYLDNDRKHDFISQPRGDQAMAFRVEGLRKVGFFDERFTTLHYQEIDYFYRAMLSLGARCSINDDHLGDKSNWNPIGCELIVNTFSGFEENDNLHTSKSHLELKNLFLAKWRIGEAAIHDIQTFGRSVGKDLSFMASEINWYPFFWEGSDTSALRFSKAYESPALPIYLRCSRRLKVMFPRLHGLLRRVIR